MGYETFFHGYFEIKPALTQSQINYMHKFCETRRMKRDVDKLGADPVRTIVNLPCGKDGEYFVGGTGLFGQDRDDSVVDYNKPPAEQPGLWCHWTVNKTGEELCAEGGKFYDYIEWLDYVILNFILRWSRTLNGEVGWYGEEPSDRGIIRVKNNKIFVGKAVTAFVFNEYVRK